MPGFVRKSPVCGASRIQDGKGEAGERGQGKILEPRRNFEYTASPAALRFLNPLALPRSIFPGSCPARENSRRIRKSRRERSRRSKIPPYGCSRLFFSRFEDRLFSPLPFLDAYHKRRTAAVVAWHFIVDSCFTPTFLFPPPFTRNTFVAGG